MCWYLQDIYWLTRYVKQPWSWGGNTNKDCEGGVYVLSLKFTLDVITSVVDPGGPQGPGSQIWGPRLYSEAQITPFDT